MPIKYKKLLSLLFLLLFLFLSHLNLAPIAQQQQQQSFWCQNWAVVSLHQHQKPPTVSLHQHQTPLQAAPWITGASWS